MTKPTPIHNAALIKAAADGYQMQVRTPNCWRDTDTMHALNLLANQHPMSATIMVRVKPHVICINGHEVPAPMQAAPELHSRYWTVSLITDPTAHRWDDTPVDIDWLIDGVCHSTEAGAAAHAEALLSLTRQDAQ